MFLKSKLLQYLLELAFASSLNVLGIIMVFSFKIQ